MDTKHHIIKTNSPKFKKKKKFVKSRACPVKKKQLLRALGGLLEQFMRVHTSKCRVIHFGRAVTMTWVNWAKYYPHYLWNFVGNSGLSDSS